MTPRGRALLCERVGGGMRVSEAAAMVGVSRQTVSKWFARVRRGEPMADRGCRPRRLARLLLAPLALAAETGVPARTSPGSWPAGACRAWVTSTASRASRVSTAPSRSCATSASAPGSRSASTSRRCRAQPRGGHRALGRDCGSRRGAGTSCLHVAVDDNSRVAYAEQLPDEREETARAFMGRAIAFYEGLGVAVERVMTDNGLACRSGEFNAPLEAHGIRHKYTRPFSHTRPFSPWQNGKVERMNGTLAREWQYARA